MKKSDLKTGMRVKTRNGNIYLVVKDVDATLYGHQDVALVNNNSFILLDDYNEDLTDNSNSNYDIVEVFQITWDANSLLSDSFLNLDERFSIWKREEFTDRQKEVFKALKLLGFNWIARDDIDDALLAYDEKPRKKGGYWVVGEEDYTCDITYDFAFDFDFIKGEDKEPFKIPEL